jgi:hypothetical protein
MSDLGIAAFGPTGQVLLGTIGRPLEPCAKGAEQRFPSHKERE